MNSSTLTSSFRDWPQTLGLAARNLTRQPRRTAIAIAAISFGVVALMLASGFIDWIFFDMRESTIHSRLGHLQIVRPGYHANGHADSNRYLLPDGGVDFERLASNPSVRTIAPRLSFAGLASKGDTTLSFLADAVMPARETELSRALTIVEGRDLQADDRGAAIFGAGLARNLDVRVGDRVVLLVTKPSGGINATEVVVQGLFTTITKSYDDAALRVPLATAQRLLGSRGAHVWVALLDKTEATDRVALQLRSLLPKQFEVVTWYELADFYRKTVALFSRQTDVVRIIIAAIILLGISNTMMMTVTERTGEIGTSMALGVPRRGILTLFLLEGALLGVCGGALGVLLGTMLAEAISAIGIPMPPPPGMDRGYTAQVRITMGLAVDAFVLAVATTLVATIYPAWKASRLEIVDALRHNR